MSPALSDSTPTLKAPSALPTLAMTPSVAGPHTVQAVNRRAWPGTPRRSPVLRRRRRRLLSSHERGIHGRNGRRPGVGRRRSGSHPERTMPTPDAPAPTRVSRGILWRGRDRLGVQRLPESVITSCLIGGLASSVCARRRHARSRALARRHGPRTPRIRRRQTSTPWRAVSPRQESRSTPPTLAGRRGPR